MTSNFSLKLSHIHGFFDKDEDIPLIAYWKNNLAKERIEKDLCSFL